jgi:hypothetical protein
MSVRPLALPPSLRSRRDAPSANVTLPLPFALAVPTHFVTTMPSVTSLVDPDASLP